LVPFDTSRVETLLDEGPASVPNLEEGGRGQEAEERFLKEKTTSHVPFMAWPNEATKERRRKNTTTTEETSREI